MKAHITQFTIREDKLLERARAVGLTLPERLAQWTAWIQDSELYLNELRNAVVEAEENHQKPERCHECHREMEPGSSYLLCTDCAAKSEHNKD